jgi:hypothetical protein
MSPLSVALDLTRFDDLSRVRCSRCQSSLDLHQPDVERPERLLGMCEDCRSWFLMAIDEGFMIRLPEDLHAIRSI